MKENKEKRDVDKLPEALEAFLKSMGKLLSWVSKVALDTSNFIFRLIKQCLDAILKITKTFVRWIGRIIETTFKFIYKFFMLFWDIRKQMLIYCCLYIPSLLFWIIGLKGLSKAYATGVIIITIIVAFQKKLRKNNKTPNH